MSGVCVCVCVWLVLDYHDQYATEILKQMGNMADKCEMEVKGLNLLSINVKLQAKKKKR